MNYQDRIKLIKADAKRHPEWTDREISIMLDAAFGEKDEEE